MAVSKKPPSHSRPNKKQNTSASRVSTLHSESLASLTSSEDIAILPHSSSFYADNSLLDQFSTQQSIDSNSNSNFVRFINYWSSHCSQNSVFQNLLFNYNSKLNKIRYLYPKTDKITTFLIKNSKLIKFKKNIKIIQINTIQLSLPCAILTLYRVLTLKYTLA